MPNIKQISILCTLALSAMSTSAFAGSDDFLKNQDAQHRPEMRQNENRPPRGEFKNFEEVKKRHVERMEKALACEKASKSFEELHSCRPHPREGMGGGFEHGDRMGPPDHQNH